MKENEIEKEELHEWKSVAANTWRMKVSGGYIYQTIEAMMDDRQSNAMVFVPDIDLQRYQSHLRDAYKQGYRDGQEDAKNGIVET